MCIIVTPFINKRSNLQREHVQFQGPCVCSNSAAKGSGIFIFIFYFLLLKIKCGWESGNRYQRERCLQWCFVTAGSLTWQKNLTFTNVWVHQVLAGSWVNCLSEAVTHSMRIKAPTHPSALPSDELVIFSLDAGSAASVVVLLLKVRVVLKLLRCLGKTNKQAKTYTHSMYQGQQSSYSK